MINGYINQNLEAVISLTLQGMNGEQDQIEAIIDTGFNSFLTLPHALINSLGLPWLTQGRVTLANGQEELFDIFAATVIWDGVPRRIMVDAADTEPLVGMALMQGYELKMQVIIEGVVTLTPLSGVSDAE